MQTTGGTALNASRRFRAIAWVIAVLGFAADQATKALALAFLDPLDPPVLLGGLLRLQLIRNPGAAFSMGEGFTVVLTVIAVLAAVFVAGWLVPRVRHRGWAVGSGLLLAGVLGNLTDRLIREPAPFHGHVIDFLQLPYFAIFNVADICITFAAITIVWMTAVAQIGVDGRSTREAPSKARS